MDFLAEIVQLHCRRQRAVLPMWPEYAHSRNMLGASDSEEYTSESKRETSSRARVESDNGGDEEKLLLMLADDSSAATGLVKGNELEDDE